MKDWYIVKLAHKTIRRKKKKKKKRKKHTQRESIWDKRQAEAVKKRIMHLQQKGSAVEALQIVFYDAAKKRSEKGERE